ncbi:cysteine synthase [Salix suchowensis]|nr:cysteine synthase [Salix suchowensis]
MAFLLPNLSPSLLINSKSCKDKEKPILHQTQSLHTHYQTTPTATATKTSNTDTSMSPPLQEQHHRDEFYVNLGLAFRTLREVPLLFTEDLNYDIYRDDITFIDPLNTFTGIDSYKLIFWASTFHGKMLFREISLEHKVDNLAFSFPQTLKPAASVLDLVAACPASPNPTFLWGPVDICSSSL